MDWQPVQGVPRLSPDDRWDRLQPSRVPTDGLSRYRKLMDGFTVFVYFPYVFFVFTATSQSISHCTVELLGFHTNIFFSITTNKNKKRSKLKK